MDGFAAKDLRLKLQQKQALVGSVDPISVFALDLLQIDFLLWSLVGNISNKVSIKPRNTLPKTSQTSVKQHGVQRKRGGYNVPNVPN